MQKYDCLNHPGGIEITKRAFDICSLPKSAKVLDIGCGHGDTAAYLTSGYGFSVTGLDKSTESITQAKQKHPDIEFIKGDGQWLDFDSLSFDCVLIECALSLMTLPVETIHEAYCVLKEGGYLIIHDLYIPHPSNEDLEIIAKTGKSNEEQIEGACREERKSTCTVNGALVLNEIHNALSELGFRPVLFEDRKTDLDSYAASLIFNGSDSKDLYQSKTKLSYFLMLVRKANN